MVFIVFSSKHMHSCTRTHTQTSCGLAVATADAVHEYFSQTLWQSFHLHGPDVSSWNIYHTGPGRSRPQLCECECECVCVCVCMCESSCSILAVLLFVCLFIKVTVSFFFLSSLSDRDCQAVERDLCSAHPLPVTGGGTHTCTLTPCIAFSPQSLLCGSNA